jgi:phosphatidate cytidylyltransferase
VLKQRIIVALIFLPIFIWLIYLPNAIPFFILVLAALALALLELAGMIKLRGIAVSRTVTLPAILGLGLVSGFTPEAGWLHTGIPGLLWSVGILAMLLLCFRELFFAKTETSFQNMSAGLFSILLLGGVGCYVILLRRLPEGSSWIIMLFGFNWIYDSAALFSGKLFGRRKLAPLISPGKTVEGLIGGLAVNAVAAVIAYYAWLPPQIGFSLLGFVGLGLGIGLLAQAGDLVESLIKRWSGIKDSSGFIPGHGGILDKIDSTIFTAPALYCVARLLLHL